MIRSMLSLFAIVLLLGSVGGCASSGTSSVAAGPHAECLVCKKNADLACVDIPVDASTPNVEYAGQKYYFCSDECRNTFSKDPSRYISSK